MKNFSLMSLLIASALATGCAFEQTSKLFGPTAPSETSGPAGSTSTTGSSSTGSSSTGSGNPSGSSTPTPASAFSGAWGSSTIAGLPLGNCSDVKWLINDQTESSVSGTVTANCASGVNVAANLTGTMQSDNVISLAATGTLTAMGLPCQFNLNGTGTRQAGDTMKVDYSGSYCLGTVNGTETLRKFPNI
jgi:hypothetical protein